MKKQLSERAVQLMWFSSGAAAGLASLTFAVASVPSTTSKQFTVTDDTAIYQNLSEIDLPKQPKISFDSDIQRLASLESGYRETLPSLKDRESLRGPMGRISKKKYRFSGSSSQKTARR